MAQPPALTPRPDDRLLLAEQGASALPSPVALQLLEIPIVLPVQKQPAAVGDRLPDSLWRLEYELVAADRTRYRVRVTGDPVLGLPYGRDADVLLALFRILDEEREMHDLGTGTFRQPSFQMICRALGMGATGPLVQRIRDALRRLSHVRIESRVLVDRSAEAAQLLASDGAAPAAPTASTVRRHEIEESRWLLEYRTEERTVEERATESDPDVDVAGTGNGADGRVERTLWVHELRLNPFWVNQAISGWAGWIDVERHADLKSITARRLYQLCAAYAARHVRTPWVLPEHELRAACMLSTDGKKPTRVRQMLTDAAAELVEAGVLGRHEWHGTPRRGPMELVLEPGPLLQLSGLLRGVGLTDPPDVRIQYALLRAFGVTAPKARAVIAEKPSQVAEVLLRACHLRATDPTAVTKSWAGWIIHHVEHDTSFAGEVGFQQWRRTALKKLDAAPRVVSPTTRREGVAADVGRTVEPAPRNVARAPRVPADPAAATRWEAAVAAVRPGLSVLDYYGLEDGVPVESDANTLTIAVTNEIASKALQRLVPRLEAALAHAEGVQTTVRIVPTRAVAPFADDADPARP